MVISNGVDIISVERVRAIISRSGDRFLSRWFNPEEIRYCTSRVRPAEHFSARIAAKEAAIKALRVPWQGGILLKDICVSHDPSGAPRLVLGGEALRVARQRGIAEMHLSLSHCADYAVASVVAVRAPSAEP